MLIDRLRANPCTEAKLTLGSAGDHDRSASNGRRVYTCSSFVGLATVAGTILMLAGTRGLSRYQMMGLDGEDTSGGQIVGHRHTVRYRPFIQKMGHWCKLLLAAGGPASLCTTCRSNDGPNGSVSEPAGLQPPLPAARARAAVARSRSSRHPPALAINLAVVSGGWEEAARGREQYVAGGGLHEAADTELKMLVYTALLSTGTTAPIHFIFITDRHGESIIRTWFEGCDSVVQPGGHAKFTPPTFEVVIVSGAVMPPCHAATALPACTGQLMWRKALRQRGYLHNCPKTPRDPNRPMHLTPHVPL